MPPRPTNPPTTPPAIAPALDFFFDVPAAPAPPPLTPEVGVTEATIVETVEAAMLDTVAVGLELVAEDSGAVSSACAAPTLKTSPVTTSKYAQAGIEVPDGIGSGNCWGYTCEQLNLQALHVSIVRF